MGAGTRRKCGIFSPYFNEENGGNYLKLSIGPFRFEGIYPKLCMKKAIRENYD